MAGTFTPPVQVFLKPYCTFKYHWRPECRWTGETGGAWVPLDIVQRNVREDHGRDLEACSFCLRAEQGR